MDNRERRERLTGEEIRKRVRQRQEAQRLLAEEEVTAKQARRREFFRRVLFIIVVASAAGAVWRALELANHLLSKQ